MDARDDERWGGPAPRAWLWIGWAAAFAIPFLLQRDFSGRTFPLDAGGSGCSDLTEAGRAAFDDVVLPVQIALTAWVLAGVVLLGLEWHRRVAPARVMWPVVGWWPPGLIAAAYCALGPASGSAEAAFSGLFVAIVIAPWALLLLAPAAFEPGPSGRRPWPLWLLSPVCLVGAALLGATFGGTGEIHIC